MKKIFISAFCLLPSAFLLAGPIEIPANAGTRLAAVEGSTNALNTRVGTAETDITALEGSTNALNTRVGTAETDITALNGATNALNTRMDAAESGTNALQVQATANSAGTNALNTRMDAAEAGTNALNAKFATVYDGSYTYSDNVSYTGTVYISGGIITNVVQVGP